MRLESLHLYPVKGCHRIDVDRATVQPWGLAGDRRWLIVDADGQIISQREDPALTGIRPSLVEGDLRLSATGRPDLTVPPPTGNHERVDVWGDTVPLSPAGPAADGWLSATLGRPARLYHLDDPTSRPVDPSYSRPDDRVSLADAYPLMVTSSASLDALNGALADEGSAEGPLPMTRFRPSAVVGGADAWAEDGWIGRRLRIGPVVFRAVKPCDRCVVTTTDQETGVRGHEPLRFLGRHRNVDQKLLFGVNLIPDDTGDLAAGDEVTLLDP